MIDLSLWCKFHVRTLNDKGLDDASAQLAAMAEANFRPNLYLGIRTGGYVVAERMQRALPSPVPLLSITCRRPSTEKKSESSTLKTVLKNLPTFVNDRLRVMEHVYLTQLRAPRAATLTADAAELSAIAEKLRDLGGEARLLVIDDSIDSGATFAAVLDALRPLLAAGATMKTAAITVTTARPLVEPDFALYRYALCRFPWSFDFRG